jgi:hypothetical protein
MVVPRALSCRRDILGLSASKFTTCVSPFSIGGSSLCTLEDKQFFASLHLISHFGFGQDSGFVHSHVHKGSAQTLWQF